MGAVEDDNDEVSRQLAALDGCREEIIRDLNVQDVMTELLSGLVITHRDKQYIDHEKSLEDKAERLLTILKDHARSNVKGKESNRKNPHVIPVFINALKPNYDWLYKRLTEDVPDSRVIPLSPEASSSGDVFSSGGGTNGHSSSSLMENNNVIIREDKVLESLEERRFRVILELGGVQCLPGVVVKRLELLEQVREGLRKLERNRFLVIVGMAGCGKSVLATQAVNDSSLVMSKYSDGIFWLSIGKDCSEAKDALLAKMRILCEKLGVPQAPNSFDHGADLLRTAFLGKPNALLVLDDVWRSEVIRAFDVGCRIVVTTRDINVMFVDQARFSVIKVDEGFTEDESLELFSKVLNIDKTGLPHQAKSVHTECKGSPMVISLISSLLQDHGVLDDGRWQYYLEALSKRKYSKMRKVRSYEHPSVIDAISLSIDNLSEEKRGLYMDFALFQDDVRIPCSVFMTLWKMQKYEVEDIMKDFVKKSLAVEEYDYHKKCYVYSINNLLLSYLKYQLSSMDSTYDKDSHQLLVDRYMDVCNKDFSKLPDDGYIFFYLGYHLYKSKMYSYFPKIYLDLMFIGEKLRITGTADLLQDIRKYLDFIVGESEERRRTVEEIQTFAQLVGHRIYGQLDVDVIQVALQNPHLQRIHTQARNLALIAGNRLYLEWKNAKAGQWKHPESSVLCGDHVTCVRFVGTGGRHFIAGLSNGCIQLCDLESSAVCHNFRGHSDAINSLQVYPSSNPLQCATELHRHTIGEASYLRILSASNDKTCSIWNLKSVLDELESKPFEFKQGRVLGSSPSPKLRPDQWGFDSKMNESLLTFSLHTAPVTHAQYSLDGLQIVSTSTNEIMIWSSTNAQIVSRISLTFESNPSLTLQQCLFPPELSPTYLVCSAENQIVLMSAESASVYSGVEAHLTRIVEILFISQDKFCSVSENEIGIWSVEKRNPKAKAFRSRSLSPARSMMINPDKTEPDSVVVRPNSKTLDPKDIQLRWNQASDSSGIGDRVTSDGSSYVELDSPTSHSLDLDGRRRRESGTISVYIRDRNGIVQISKQDTLPSFKSRSFLCASFALSGDGRSPLLACGTADHKIVLWRLDFRDCIGRFTSHSGWVTALDFSLVDSFTLLSGSEDQTVMVWDIEAEEMGMKEPMKLMQFVSKFVADSFDGGYFISIFSTEINTLQVYKGSKKVFESEPLKEHVTCLSVSDNGELGAVGLSNGNIFYIRINGLISEKNDNISYSTQPQHASSGVLLQYAETSGSKVKCMKFGASDQVLLVGCSDGSFMILENCSAKQKFLICDRAVFDVDFVNENHVVAVALDSSVAIIRLSDMKSIYNWRSQKDVCITSSAISRAALGPIIALGTSDHGLFLFTLSMDLRNVRETCLDTQSTSPLRSLAVNARGSKLAIGYDNGMISIWSLESDTPKKEMDYVLHKSWVQCLKFSQENLGNTQWLVSCGDKLAVWNVDKFIETKPRRPSFMEERRRRRSGESPVRSTNRLSLEIPIGSKIGKQGKRELLQQFSLRGNLAQRFFTDPHCDKIVTVDDTGVFYLLETLKVDSQNPLSAKI